MIGHAHTPVDELLEQWPHLRKAQRLEAFQKLPHEYMDNFFLELDARAQAKLVVALPEGERRMFVRLLAPDDAADLIQEAPEEQRQYLMGLMDDTTREETSALLHYREDVA